MTVLVTCSGCGGDRESIAGQDVLCDVCHGAYRQHLAIASRLAPLVERLRSGAAAPNSYDSRTACRDVALELHAIIQEVAPCPE